MRILLDTNLWVAALISLSMGNRIERILADGQADYLLTGDDDLLSLHSFEKTRILTLTEFEQVL